MISIKIKNLGDAIATKTQDSRDTKHCMCDTCDRFDSEIADTYRTGYRAGFVDGMMLVLVRQVCKKLDKQKTPSVIACELEEGIGIVRAICEIAFDYGPNYSGNALTIFESFVDSQTECYGQLEF